MESLQGHLLVASPHLGDSNFFRSVVFMVQHSSEGALGLVLNQPSDRTVGEIWTELGSPCDNPQPIRVGGPCPGPIMALHTLPEAAEEEVAPEVYFASRRDHLNEIVLSSSGPFRIFSGYSGWAGGQLESELAEGSWLATPGDFDTIFSDDQSLWKKVTHRIGADVMYSSLRIKRAPGDAEWN